MLIVCALLPLREKVTRAARRMRGIILLTTHYSLLAPTPPQIPLRPNARPISSRIIGSSMVAGAVHSS